MPYASNSGAMPRPSPSVKRPPVSRCIVVACDAVTIGWRVLWLVAAVAMPSVDDTAPTAPDSVTASLMLKRSEMKVEPRPSASPAATSSISSARRLRRAGEHVEAELVERLEVGGHQQSPRRLAEGQLPLALAVALHHEDAQGVGRDASP